MKRWIKICSRLILYPVALIVFIFFVIFLLLQTDTGKDKIKGFVVGAVEKALHAELQVGRISGDLLFELSLEDVSLSGKDGLVLKADRISVNYLAPMLLKKVVFIKGIRLYGLDLNLVKEADGTWNIAALIPNDEDKATKEDKPAPFDIILNRISVLDANVILTQKGLYGAETRHFKDIQFAARLKTGPVISAQILDASFTSDRPFFFLSGLKGMVSYDLEAGHLYMKNICIKTRASDLTVNGKLDLSTDGPDMDVTAAIKALSLQELGRFVSVSALDHGVVNGSLIARGKLSHLYHQLELNLDLMSVRTHGHLYIKDSQGLDLDVSGAILHLDPAALHHLGLPRMKGDVNADIVIKGTNLTQLERRGQATVRLKDSRLAGYEIDEALVNLVFDRGDLVVEDGRLTSGSGRVGIRGKLAGILDSARNNSLKLEASFQDLDLAGLIRRKDIYGKINLDLNAVASLPGINTDPAGIFAQIIARIKPSNVLGVDINQGHLNATWADQKLVIKSLDISTGAGRLTLTGSAVPQNRTCQLQVDSTLPDLQNIEPLIYQFIPHPPEKVKLGGSLDISGQLKGWWNRPQITATVKGSAIRFNNVSAGACKLKGTWKGLPEDFTSRVISDLKDLKINENSFTKLNIKANLTQAKVLADLSLEHEYMGEAVLAGEVEQWLQPTKHIFLYTLKLTAICAPQTNQTANKMIYQMENQGPIRMTISKDFFDITSFNLSSDQAVLSLAGRLSLTGNQGMNISLKNMDLSCLPRFWEEGGRISGLLSADMSISGTAKDPVIQARVLVKDGSGYDFAFSDLDIMIRCAESKAFVKAALSMEDKKILDLKGNTGFLISLNPVALKPLAGTLDANVEISELKFSDLPFLTTPEWDFDGLLDLKVSATGDITSPILKGNLSVRQGALSLKDPELTYEFINGEFAFSPDKIIINRVQIKGDKEGTLICTGELTMSGMKPVALNIRLNGEDFYVPFKRAIYARIEPDLTLSGKLTAPRLTGTLSIIEGKINLDRLSDQEPSEVQVISHKPDKNEGLSFPDQEAEVPAFINPLAADIIVKIPKNLWLKGQDVNAEIAGQIILKKDPGRPFILLGPLDTVRGKYNFRGKLFKITEGKVTFIGLEDPDPNLNIQAKTRVKNVDIIIHITGTARQIRLSLDSDPQMDQADIISYLVFGKPTSALKGQETFHAEKAALNITGKIAAAELKNIIGEVFHLDAFTIETGGEDISKTAVSLGKYIAPDVFVTYRRRFNVDQPHQIEVTYDINRNLKVETQLGDEKTNGIDLFWEYDF